jgi:uncharacterized protein (DUF1501 family)
VNAPTVKMLKADVGLEIAFADVGGWDTHVNQGGATGQLANRRKHLGAVRTDALFPGFTGTATVGVV